MLPQFAYSKNNTVLQFKLTYVIIVLACNILSYLLHVMLFVAITSLV